MSDLTPRTSNGSRGLYDTAEVVEQGADGVWRSPRPKPTVIYRDGPTTTVTVTRVPTWWVIFIPAILLAFLGGLFIDDLIEDGSPADDRGFVNVRGHEGEVLVVDENGDLRWCIKPETTYHGCEGG